MNLLEYCQFEMPIKLGISNGKTREIIAHHIKKVFDWQEQDRFVKEDYKDLWHMAEELLICYVPKRKELLKSLLSVPVACAAKHYVEKHSMKEYREVYEDAMNYVPAEYIEIASSDYWNG